MHHKVRDIFAQSGVGEEPIVEALRAFQPTGGRKQQKWGCRQHRQEYSYYPKRKRDTTGNY